MKKLILLLSIIFVVFACAKAPTDVPKDGIVTFDNGTYQMPVTFDDTVTFPSMDGENKVVEFEIPPSTKTTHIAIKPKEKSFIQKIFPSKEETYYDVITDNKDVKTTAQPHTPWWWWFIGALVLALVSILVLSYFKRSIPGFSWILRLFKR